MMTDDIAQRHGAARRWTRPRSARSDIASSTSSPTRSRRCRDGPVTRDESPSDVREALDLDRRRFPKREPIRRRCSTDRAAALRALAVQRPSALLRLHHVGAGADRRCSAISWRRPSTPNVGAWTLSPVATEIEAQTVRWIAELIGYPRDCGGLLVSGGNMANIVCFLAARAAKAGWNVRERGVIGDAAAPASRLRARPKRTRGSRRPPTSAASAPTRFAGSRPTSELRMDVAALRRQIVADRAAGDVPCMVVGTAGSVSTGAVDPLPEIAAVCRRTTSGSTSTARTAASRRRSRCARRPAALSAGRLGRGRSAQVALRAARGRMRAGARSRARCGAAFSYHPPLLPLRRAGDQLRRLRSAELPRLPRAQGLAGAAARRAPSGYRR